MIIYWMIGMVLRFMWSLNDMATLKKNEPEFDITYDFVILVAVFDMALAFLWPIDLVVNVFKYATGRDKYIFFDD